jgi:tRNA(Arg) A34 adenosine deaminase TadA/GNAT superfamily N-acetyltransferase
MRRALDGGYELDDDRDRVDRAAVHRYLAEDSYWAAGRTRAVVDELVASAARVVGLYHDGRQVGFARVISDGHTQSYLADVYVLPEHRGRGLGAELVRFTVDEGPHAHTKWVLHTADAHDLYRKLGFREPGERTMERGGRARLSEVELALLRRAIALSAEAAARGDRPFGALLADPAGSVVAEAANTQTTGADPTAHAESNLVRLVVESHGADALRGGTVFASGEPCAMCAGTLYWSGVARVVYGLGADRIHELTGTDGEALQLGCRELLARGGRRVEVVGPALEDEAARPFGPSRASG